MTHCVSPSSCSAILMSQLKRRHLEAVVNGGGWTGTKNHVGIEAKDENSTDWIRSRDQLICTCVGKHLNNQQPVSPEKSDKGQHLRLTLSVLSAAVSGCRCGELIWICLVWAERSTPDGFGVPSHRLNSATGEQKWITQTILLTPSRPAGCPTHWYGRRQAEKRKPPSY